MKLKNENIKNKKSKLLDYIIKDIEDEKNTSPGITLKYIGIEEEDINKLYEGIEI